MSKKTDWFKGIFPALVTPFTADDQVDEAAYRELIRFVLPHVDGVVPCGTTGEFSSMTQEEKRRTIEICIDEVAGRLPVLAGSGCQSTIETLELTQWAKQAGATGALIVAPYFLKPAFNETFDHYKQVDKIGLPLKELYAKCNINFRSAPIGNEEWNRKYAATPCHYNRHRWAIPEGVYVKFLTLADMPCARVRFPFSIVLLLTIIVE